MQVDGDYLLNIFRKIRNVKEYKRAYLLGGDDPRLSVDDLIKVVSEMYGLNIQVWGVAVDTEHVPGMLARQADAGTPTLILISSRLDEYWQRFVATKELSQIIIDEREDWCPDGILVIDDLLTAVELDKKANGNHEPEKRTANEHMAEIVAIELMYPYECRHHNATMLANHTTTLAKLEIKYRLPAVMIARAHSAWYQTICDQIWPKVQSE